MPDILQDFPIQASPARVFDAVTQPSGLNAWWTESCVGIVRPGSLYRLGFGPEYAWEAILDACEAPTRVSFRMTKSDADWAGTRVEFDLLNEGTSTSVRFAHRGWPEANAHFRTSAHCWALYLRVLRRHLEFGECVPYALRLSV